MYQKTKLRIKNNTGKAPNVGQTNYRGFKLNYFTFQHFQLLIWINRITNEQYGLVKNKHLANKYGNQKQLKQRCI